MTVFEIKNLTKVYGTRTLLDIPDLRFERGRIYGLLGPNGAGKTTLLDILSFLVAPSSGRIWYEGREVVFSESHLHVLRREVVLVPQHPIMFTGSVLKNVEFGLRMRSTPKAEREKVVNEMLELVGLTAFAQAKAHRLSGGETQRAAIARALACSPKVILFDEPTASVDIENQAGIAQIIRDINRLKGITVILTTHNLVQASSLTHEIVYLFNGRITPALSENIFSGTLTRTGEETWIFRAVDRLEFELTAEHICRYRVRFGAEPMAAGAKLLIDPRLIRLTRNEVIAGTAGIAGRVMQLTEVGEDVRVTVDLGIPISAIISPEEYRRLGCLLREPVRVEFPPEALELF